MAAGFLGSIKLAVNGSYKGANDLGTPLISLAELAAVDLVEGTATGAADLLFADERTLSASATENLDLAGALTSPLGQTLTFVTVKAIIVIANSANTNSVIVGGHGSAAFVGPFGAANDTVSVKPGGIFAIAHGGAGWAVTATTADMLTITNSGGTTGVTYRVIILGTSA